jgi:hypothetical protein
MSKGTMTEYRADYIINQRYLSANRYPVLMHPELNYQKKRASLPTAPPKF